MTQRPHATRGARPQVLHLPEFRDERGCLSAAHREVLELIAAAAGSFTVDCDDGDSTTEFSLQAPSAALLVPALVWREVRDFSPGAVCLVLASGPYREKEYIRDREEFSQLVDAS